MTALRKTILVEEAPVAVPAARAPRLYLVRNEPTEAATEPAGDTLKNIALFFAAPFLGLVYIVALPLVGLGAVAVLAVRAAARFPALRAFGLALKHIGMLLAAPFIGLAYVVLFPIVCLAVLAWTGARAVAGTDMR